MESHGNCNLAADRFPFLLLFTALFSCHFFRRRRRRRFALLSNLGGHCPDVRPRRRTVGRLHGIASRRSLTPLCLSVSLSVPISRKARSGGDDGGGGGGLFSMSLAEIRSQTLLRKRTLNAMLSYSPFFDRPLLID